MSGDPLIGQILANRYRVVRVVGKGGMGAVYEALQLDLDRRVAIKVLKPEVADDPEYIERFRREAFTAARLRHPNIPQILEFVAEPGAPFFIVMELLGGTSLHDVVLGGRMACDRACAIAAQLASALSAAHDAGIVHRDIKPGNVVLVPFAGGDLAMLLDFGVAKLRESAGYARISRTGILVGTPRYASPEQALGRSDVDARSDIYSLGVLLYRMLSGNDPFTSVGSQLLIDIRDATPPDLRAIAPDVPLGVVDIVVRAMQKEPGRRFATARQMGAALEPFYARASGPALAQEELGTLRGGIHAPMQSSAHEAETKAPSDAFASTLAQTPMPLIVQPAPVSLPAETAKQGTAPEGTSFLAMASFALAALALLLTLGAVVSGAFPGAGTFVGALLSFGAPAVALVGIVLGGIGMSRARDSGLAIGALSVSIIAFFAAFLVAMSCGVCNSVCATNPARPVPRTTAPP